MKKKRRNLYSAQFYKLQSGGSFDSAKAVCPLIMQYIDIYSVLDLGCGVGTWLSAFVELGVKDVIGIDGSYVNKKHLFIDPSRFIAGDLQKPVNLNRKFDLAMSLEVAEHLPKISAKTLVDSLCAHSDAVLFSAAIPGQTGTNHINCQWPSYWASLFKQNGYSCMDFIRPQIWNNEKIMGCYRQNIMLYVKEDSELIREINRKTEGLPPLMDLIHPVAINPKTCGLLTLLHMQAGIIQNIVPAFISAVKKRC